MIRIVEWGWVCEDGSRETFGTVLKVDTPAGTVEREITHMSTVEVLRTAVDALGIDQPVEVATEFERDDTE